MLKKIVRAVLFVIAVLVTIGVLFHAVTNWSGRRAWDAYRHDQEARGVPFAWAAIVPAPVPDDRNFAMTPLFVEVFKNATNGVKGRIDALNFSSSLSTTNAGDWKSGRRSSLVDDIVRPKIAAGDSDWRDAMAILDELTLEMSRRPDCRFPVDYEAGYMCLLPHVGKLRDAGRTFKMRALLALAKGRSDDARADMDAMWRMADAVENEPTIISLLIRMAGQDMALHVLWEGMLDHRWTAAQLAEMQTRFAAVNMLDHLRRALDGERIFARTTIESLLRDRTKTWEVITIMQVGDAQEQWSPSALLFRLCPRGWYYHNMLEIDRFYTERVFPVLDIPARRIDVAAVTAASTASQQERTTPASVLRKIILPSIDAVVRKVAEHAASLDYAVTACAIERYRLANGRLPDSLAALASDHLPTPPRRVSDGAALEYRRTGEDRWELSYPASPDSKAPAVWRSHAAN